MTTTVTYLPASPGYWWIDISECSSEYLDKAPDVHELSSWGKPIVAWRIQRIEDEYPNYDDVRRPTMIKEDWEMARPVTFSGEPPEREINDLRAVMLPDGRIETIDGVGFENLIAFLKHGAEFARRRENRRAVAAET